MMVSQPRRIAANSLMKRLRQTLGDKVSAVTDRFSLTFIDDVDWIVGGVLSVVGWS